MAELGETKDPTELVSGSPAGLRELARDLAELAGDFDGTAAKLSQSDPGPNWDGEAGSAFDAYFSEEPGRWRRAAEAFRTTAAALDRYAETLAWGQGQAGDAIRHWDAGDHDAAKETLNRAREQVDSAATAAERTVDPERDAAPQRPRLAPFDPARASGQTIPTVYIDADKYPETAKHVEEAQSGTTWRGDDKTHGAPHPSTVTIDRPNAKQNRKDSLRGIPTKRGKDRDEYPPAMFEEGGKGASVKYITPADNRGAGSSMGHQINELQLADGRKVDIVVINDDDDQPDDGDGGDDGGDDGGGGDGGDGGDGGH